MMSGVVSCLCWIPKGAAKSIPDKIGLEKDELDTLIGTCATDGRRNPIASDIVCTNDSDNVSDDNDDNNGGDGSDSGDNGGNGSDNGDGSDSDDNDNHGSDEDSEDNGSDDEIDKLYGLENYSDDEDCVTASGSVPIPSLAGLTAFANNDDDPHITLKDIDDNESDDDFIIQPNDNLLLVGQANEELSTVQVHVYSEEDNNSFCHHEVLINSYPLAIEWLDYDPELPETKGNFFAVGTMLPVIEIWDIDLVDAPEPVCVLGVISTEEKKSKKHKLKKKKKEKDSDTTTIDSHSDAVMGLSWNQSIRSILASASADNTVRIWDLSNSKSLIVLKHPDKVQTLKWHPTDPSLLATGCYDGIVRLHNCESGNLLKQWKITGEVEKLLWNHFKPKYLLVSTDQMKVISINTKTDKVVFTLDAHADAVTDISLSSSIKGLLVTCSIDDTLSFWDIQKKKKPKFLYSRTLHMGGILCAKFCVDDPYTVAIGGQTSAFDLLNVLTLPPLQDKCKKEKINIPVKASNPTLGDNDDIVEDEQEDNVGTEKLSKSVKNIKRKPSSHSADGKQSKKYKKSNNINP